MEAKQKVAIVTGGAKGIGKIITSCLLSKGYKVYVFEINSTLGNETTSEFQERYGKNSTTFIQCDVSSKTQFTEAFNNAVKESGHISLMVNNAGILNEHNYEKCIAINLVGAVTGTNLAVSHMRADLGGKGGTIVNISSIAAIETFYYIPTYCATKSAILSFTRNWAENPKLKNVNFMSICPEAVDTDLFKYADKNCLDPVVMKQGKAKLVFIRPEAFEEAFWQLVTEGTNGSILKITTSGIEYLVNPPIAGVKQKDEI